MPMTRMLGDVRFGGGAACEGMMAAPYNDARGGRARPRGADADERKHTNEP